MELCKLLDNLDYEVISGNLYVDVEHICYNSLEVKEGSLFICLNGKKHDGHYFVEDANTKGASVIVVEKEIEFTQESTTIIKVSDTRMAMAKIAENYYNQPQHSFQLIGVTGTNGKTSVTHMLASVLMKLDKRVGTIGTLGYLVNNEMIEFKKTTPTTPESLDLHAVFSEMKGEQVEYVIMEVSSMALEMQRVNNCQFDVGIFTNFSQDHLDDHGTIENYKNAKLKLFPLTHTSVVNIDDGIATEVCEQAAGSIFTYSLNSKSNLLARNVKNEIKGSTFTLDYEGRNYTVETKIPGRFSVYNTLAVIGTCIKLGFQIDEIIKAVSVTTSPPGRFEILETNTQFTVIVDYAHSPDALEKIAKTIMSFPINRLITVFGCGGNRDPVKRPIMGKVTSHYSDLCIVTSDNPRFEDPERIIENILEGIKDKEKVMVKSDRKEAIELALNSAKDGDVVLIAGKGDENYQIIGDVILPFDDRKVVYDFFRA